MEEIRMNQIKIKSWNVDRNSSLGDVKVLKAIPIINENSLTMAQSISTNLNIYAQSSLWRR
jgi:hypothetical protein